MTDSVQSYPDLRSTYSVSYISFPLAQGVLAKNQCWDRWV